MNETTQETYSGKKIDLLNPDSSQICIKDIARALSKVCRFNGHVNVPYSVAEHSMWVAELVPKHLKLEALLHDASEAYICDIPTPMKNLLGDTYRQVEHRLQAAIGKATGCDGLELLHPLTKEADAVMLITERDYLRDGREHDWGHRELVLRIPKWKPLPLTCNGVASAFLAAYEMYGGTQPIN